MNPLARLLGIIEKIIDTAPHAMETLKALKDEALSVLKEEPALAAPEVKQSLEAVVDKAAVATTTLPDTNQKQSQTQS
jgi:hypothetical protein